MPEGGGPVIVADPDHQPATTRDVLTGRPKLRIDGVWKSYVSPRTDEEVRAIERVSLEIHEGEFLAIVGPSGCGKSTLLKMIAGIEPVSGGEIRLDDTPITRPGPDRALVFQQYVLFPWKTVRENVEFGLRATHVPKEQRSRRVEQFLDAVGLTGFENKYPHELSGGMQQRCALARALVVDPKVLLMDEPLAAVDAQTRVLLQEELLDVWGQELPPSRRKAIVYVTHNIEEAVYLSDRVVIMTARPGRIRRVIPIDVPRPRVFQTRATERYMQLIQEIWEIIRQEIGDLRTLPAD